MACKNRARAQTSFEFMLYMSVSVLALATALPLAMRAYSPLRASYGSMAASELAGAINYNMQFGSSRFSAYVPGGICGAGAETAPVNSIEGSPLDAPVVISSSVCGSGSIENLSLEYMYNGTYSLSAARVVT